ncbi:uncharacterized protein isoform X5 [Macaca fascicularis]|uniref:uncharacterized protein isoform X2 n=1 Tax=Macaca fascicularis TaxID=9541 RepID=UPI0032B02F89
MLKGYRTLLSIDGGEWVPLPHSVILNIDRDVHTEAVQAALAKHKEWKMAVPMPSKRRSLVVQTSMDAYTPPAFWDFIRQCLELMDPYSSTVCNRSLESTTASMRPQVRPGAEANLKQLRSSVGLASRQEGGSAALLSLWNFLGPHMNRT